MGLCHPWPIQYFKPGISRRSTAGSGDWYDNMISNEFPP